MPILELINYGTIRGASQMVRWQKIYIYACRSCRRLGFNSCIRRFPEVGNSNPLRYSCQYNPMERGAWRATVHEVSELDMTELSHTQH